MDRLEAGTILAQRRFPPHTRDGPSFTTDTGQIDTFPPHTRGWTQSYPNLPPELPGFPRTRGDGPGICQYSKDEQEFPPHTRGWTVNHIL